MNIIKKQSTGIIFILALSLLIFGCEGSTGPASFNDGNTGNPVSPISPSDLIPSNPPPPAPVITTAEATTNSVYLKWTDESSREFGFLIIRDGVKVGETDRNASQWTDTSVLPATIYTYVVVAWNKEGEGVSQGKLVTTPVLPTPPPPQNHSPIISSVLANPPSIETGKQSTISCQASDSDNDPLTFIWSANVGIISGSGSTVQWTAPANTGTFTIQCEVSDGKSGSNAKSVNVIVKDSPPPPPPAINHSPAISSVLANPPSIETGKQSTISCQASDPDNDPLTYSWSANAGTFTGSGSTVQWTAPANSGTYAIQCEVSDGRGGNASGITDILVTIPVPAKWTLPQGAQVLSSAVNKNTGDVYAAGRIFVSLPGFTNAGKGDVFLAKFNPDGTLAWAKQWGTAECDDVRNMVIFNNEIFLAWHYDTYCMGGDIAKVSRFDADGNEIDAFQIPFIVETITAVDSATIYFKYGGKIDYWGTVISLGQLFPLWFNVSYEGTAMQDGITYYAGQSQLISDPAKMAEGYTAAADSATGNIIWTSRWGAQTQLYMHNIAINASGIYRFRVDAFNQSDFIIFRYDLAGNLLWTYQDATRSGWFSRAITDDAAVYAMGMESTSCGLTKINNDGTLAWQTSVTGRSIALYNNVLFIADLTNVIRRYDALTGSALP